jgi:hypothetical protein
MACTDWGSGTEKYMTSLVRGSLGGRGLCPTSRIENMMMNIIGSTDAAAAAGLAAAERSGRKAHGRYLPTFSRGSATGGGLGSGLTTTPKRRRTLLASSASTPSSRRIQAFPLL